MQNTLFQRRLFLPLLQLCLLLAFVLPVVHSVVRDNDQGALVTGAMEIANHQISPSREWIYLFDKQYGTYYLLALALKLFPKIDPITLGNGLLVMFYGTGSVLALYAAGKNGLSRRVGFMLCLVPSLILYAPFLGTSQLSMAFLLLAYPFLMRREGVKFYFGLALLALAMTMRADAFFCVPAIYTAISARRSLRQVIVDRILWLLVGAVAIPIVAGRLIAAKPSGIDASHFFNPPYFVALLVFSLGLPWLMTGAAFSVFGLRAANRRRRWFSFYAVMVGSLWWSLLYYSVQMYSARYLFPTFFSSFVLLSSRRGRCWFRWITWHDHTYLNAAVTALVVLSLVPWFVGVHLFSTHAAKLTMRDATLIPTSDGVIPMGAIAAFETDFIARHGVIDHNQQSLVAARSVRYRPCSNAHVEVYDTGMATLIMQAAEEQGYPSRIIKKDHTDIDESATCSVRYVELRGLLRGDTATDVLLHHAMHWESSPEALRPILGVDQTAPANATTQEVKDLIAVAKRTDFAYYELPARGIPRKFILDAGHKALLYTDDRRCLPPEAKPVKVPGSSGVWALVEASPKKRSIQFCANHKGAWLPAEMPQFLQSLR